MCRLITQWAHHSVDLDNPQQVLILGRGSAPHPTNLGLKDSGAGYGRRQCGPQSPQKNAQSGRLGRRHYLLCTRHCL